MIKHFLMPLSKPINKQTGRS